MVKNFSIKTAKDIELDAAVEYPGGQSNGQLAVLCPGYLDSKDYPHLVGLSKSLAGKGYVVVRFDPAGTWKSGGTTADYNVSQYLADVKSVIDFFLSEEAFNGVLLCGHSLGGMVALVYAATDERVSEVAAVMVPYAFVRPGKLMTKGVADGYKISKRDIPNGAIGKREFKVPFSMVEDSKQYDARASVRALHIPLVFIVGEKDTVVSPQDTKLIYDAANEPKKFILIKNIGHDYRRHDDEIERINK